MQGPQVNVKWKSFQSNILSSFESLWEEEGLVDVTLATDGQCLKAHKIMLSASSPFFKKIFQMNPCQHPVIVLQDVHFSELESILKFVYKGEVNILQENLPLLLRAAETLQIRGLCRQIASELSFEEEEDLDSYGREKLHSERLASKSPPPSPKNVKKLKNQHNCKQPPSPLPLVAEEDTTKLTVPVYPVDIIKCEPRIGSPDMSEDGCENPVELLNLSHTRIIDSDGEENDLSSHTNESAFDKEPGSAMDTSDGTNATSEIDPHGVAQPIINTKMRFSENLNTLLQRKANNTELFTREKYLALIEDVKKAKAKLKKETLDYRRLRKYDIVEVEGKEKLIAPLTKEKTNVLYYVNTEELFDLLHSTHLKTGHGGRTRMEKELQNQYKNVTKEVIMMYLRLCKPCQAKLSNIKKSQISKPSFFKELDLRCQVDLIDMQRSPDGEFKFILNCQDDLTKFIFLRPLKSKTAEEVAYQLLDIFTTVGAPSVLQSYNGREFATEVVNELKRMWPELKLVHGKPRPGQSHDAVIQDVQNMMTTLMHTNESVHWAKNLGFIQFMKNRSFHQGIQQSPFEAMFGRKPKIGLHTSNLPKNVVDNLIAEEDLENAEQKMNDVRNLGGSKNFPYPPFPCPFCDRSYTKWGFRRRHIKACHTRSQSLPCKWCPKVLPSHTDWESHVCLKHSLSRNDARNGLLILEEAEVVLQIPQPTRLDDLVSLIKEQKSGPPNDSPKPAEAEKENENQDKQEEVVLVVKVVK